MKIKIKREGGFIGITSKANLEFDELTADEQKTFNTLAEQTLQTAKPKSENPAQTEAAQPVGTNARSFGISPTVHDQGLELAGDVIPQNTQNNQMRDGFSYSVSMKKDGKTMSMKFDDMTAPPEIVEIFQKYVQY